MAGNPLASLPGLPQRPPFARSSASETRLTQPGIEAARSRKLNSAPTAAFRMIFDGERLTDLMEPLGLSWRERRERELALMADLVPVLNKRAHGRDISG